MIHVTLPLHFFCITVILRLQADQTDLYQMSRDWKDLVGRTFAVPMALKPDEYSSGAQCTRLWQLCLHTPVGCVSLFFSDSLKQPPTIARASRRTRLQRTSQRCDVTAVTSSVTAAAIGRVCSGRDCRATAELDYLVVAEREQRSSQTAPSTAGWHARSMAHRVAPSQRTPHVSRCFLMPRHLHHLQPWHVRRLFVRLDPSAGPGRDHGRRGFDANSRAAEEWHDRHGQADDRYAHVSRLA